MREFFEESFDLENTFENILSIQVNLNGFSFSVQCPKGKVVAFKSTALKISSNKLVARRFKEWCKSEVILHKTFKRVIVIVFNEKFTLVPNSLFSNETKEEIAHILFKEASLLQFAENQIENTHSKLLFALPEGLMQLINENIGECEIVHPVKLFINHTSKQTKDQQLLLLLDNNKIYVLVKNKQTVLFANSFTVNHANDVVYFVVSALKQLGINGKTTEVYYAGKSSYTDKIETNLDPYFSSISELNMAEINLPAEIISENIALFL